MAKQIPIDRSAVVGEDRGDGALEVLPDLAYQRLTLVNVVYYGHPMAGDRNWVLVDAGIMGSAGSIREVANKRFGEGARPAAIILTHGHFDHVGALVELADEWRTPIYAHPLEHPYLNGSASYPPADPWVGGGLVALLSPLFPRTPVDAGHHLRELPASGEVPYMPGCTWLHTPGHTPGHISLWRASDRTIIAGDAFVTTAQESAYEVAVQEPEIHGPPRYFTPDWTAAGLSVQTIAGLAPELAITGHGRALQGPLLRAGLDELAVNFRELAVPEDGRYVRNPETLADGGVYREP